MKLMGGDVVYNARYEGFTANEYTKVSSKWRLALYPSSA